MYTVEINKENQKWLIALCVEKPSAEVYLDTLPDEISELASCFEVPINDFPLIVIENCNYEISAKNYFEFCDFEELQAKIDLFRMNKVQDDQHVYFKYYYFSEDFFSSIPEKNYMCYTQCSNVTNEFLYENTLVTFFKEEVKKRSSQYDIEGLDLLFHMIQKESSEEDKKYLAECGYDSLFWDMNYDYACSKLTAHGIQSLMSMVDKMEVLLDKKLWQHRSFAYHILLSEACRNEPKNAVALLKKTEESFLQYLESHPEESLEIHRLVAQAYRMMIDVDSKNAVQYWKSAMEEIQKAIDFSPENASWSSLLELLYEPFSKHKKIQIEQLKAKQFLEEKLVELEKQCGNKIACTLALAYQELEEFLEWKKVEGVFPEMDAYHWAEKALQNEIHETTRMDLHQCATFLHRFGLKYNRIDFLEKTIQLYERILKATSDCAFEVYYIASIWKEISAIYFKNQQQNLADNALTNAIETYANYIETVKSNPSIFMHYAEFMEYCYNYDGDIEKPTLAELKTIAEKVEMQSEGYLSYPYLLLARIALMENNEKQAICEISKSLLLHELCGEDVFPNFYIEIEKTKFEELKSFITTNQVFLKEISEGYYFDPKVTWRDISKMTSSEIVACWENRKIELKNRVTETIAD